MGKKRSEYKKYLYDSNIEMLKSTHYKKIKTFHQKPSNTKMKMNNNLHLKTPIT
jgi:hypothetical protein